MMPNEMAADTPAAQPEQDGQEGGYEIIIRVAGTGEVTVDGQPVASIDDALDVVQDIYEAGGPMSASEYSEMDDLMSGYGQGGVGAKRGMPVRDVLRED